MKRRRDQAGVAGIELLGMTSLALTFGVLALNVGAALWVVTSTNEAVRQGARAQTLTGDGCAAAQASLGPAFRVRSCTASAPGTVSMTVEVPVVSEYLPALAVTRQAILP